MMLSSDQVNAITRPSSLYKGTEAEPLTEGMLLCTQEEFLQDLCEFHRARGIKNVSPDNFPDAILNGTRLDVFNLYREVTTRGGFRYADSPAE